MEVLNSIIESLKEVLSGKILVVLLVGTGIWFTARLGFVQFREFGSAFKAVFGNIKLKGDKADKNGMSSFQSLATAIAAQVGTGNLAGAATAMVMGGPGAIFWMWVSAIFGMATIFAEATLAQKYKTIGEDGEITGGPVYYIRAAFRGRLGKILAAVFAILITLALGFMGNMVQANSIADAFKGAFGINPMVIGVIVAALSAFVFIGGAARVASITEKIVPIMAAFYILGALVIIVMNYGMIPEAFRQIVVGAWQTQQQMCIRDRLPQSISAGRIISFTGEKSFSGFGVEGKTEILQNGGRSLTAGSQRKFHQFSLRTGGQGDERGQRSTAAEKLRRAVQVDVGQQKIMGIAVGEPVSYTHLDVYKRQG